MPTVVDRNPDGARLVLGDSGLLQLIKSKSTPLTELEVVPDGGRVDSRAEKSQRAGGDLGGLGLTGNPPGLGASGLVEPGADVLLPVLAEVVVGDDVVTADRHLE